MNFDPTSAQAAFAATIREAVARELTPHALAWDRDGHVPLSAVRALGALGVSGILAPPDFGGRGLDTVAYALALEEIARELPALAFVFTVHNALVGLPVARFGSEAQITGASRLLVWFAK